MASTARPAPGPLASTPAAQASARTLAPVVQKIDDQTQAAVRTVFRDLLNLLSTLPVNPVTSWLEGGLQLVRRSFFNQTAGVSSTQTANSPQLVTGKIDVIDPDGDGWNIEVVGNPGHGTVVLGTPSQADGIGKVTYTYVPGEGYTGDDQFVVKVTPASPTVNILQPEPLRVRYYTVAVGDAAEAAADRFNAEGDAPKDTLDTHLYLSNAAATVTVKKQGLFNPTYTTTLTLPAATAAKSFAWMDTRGNMGTIAVDTMLVDDWQAYTAKASENGVKPLMTFKYSDQGVEKAVVLDVDAVTKNADGSYTITGVLKDGVSAQEGRVDTWDFMGYRYQTAFNNFLNTPGLKDCKSGQECTTVSAVGVLGATTLSPSAFAETGGHDYPLPQPGDASALQTSPGSMGPGTTGVGEGNGTAVYGSTGYQELELTSMIPWGNDGSFVAATNLSLAENAAEGSGIFLYSAQAPNGGSPTWTKTQLADNSWNAAVNVMAAYDQALMNSDGTPIPTAYTGTPVTGTPNALKLAVPGDVNPSSLIGQTITGNGIASDTTITGFISSDVTGVTYSVSNPIEATHPIAVTLPDKPPTQQPGLVVGLSDGSVYYWNGTTCTKVTCVGSNVNGAEGVVMQTENSPINIAIAPNGTAYSAGESFTIIDTTKNEIIGTLPISSDQTLTFPSVVVSPDGFYAYATAPLSDGVAGVAVIDTASNTITATIALPDNATAQAVAISPDGTKGFIANGDWTNWLVNPSLFPFDPATNSLGAPITLPTNTNPWALAFSADSSKLYVSDAQNGAVLVFDTSNNTLLQTIEVQANPGALAVSPDGQYLWVTRTPNNGNNIAVIDTSTVGTPNVDVSYIQLGNGPSGIAFNPNRGLPYAYISNSNDSTIWVIDTRNSNVVGSFATGAGGDDTLGVAVTHDGLNVYLSNYDGGGDSYGTVPVYQVAMAIQKGWVQLQAAGGWGEGVAVNNIVALPNNNGFVIGLSDGTLATWNNPILDDGTIMTTTGASTGCSNGNPGACWTVYPGNSQDNSLTSINSLAASGLDGGFVAIGTNGGTGWAQGFQGAVAFEGGQSFAEIPTTLLPYDGTTLVGSIGSAPVIVQDGVISAPTYASALPDLSASSAGCSGSYSSGSGAGCAGYVLTVQQAAGVPISVGQTLYGGPGLTTGTVITQQISDGDGNLCSSEAGCSAGGTGVYLVNTSQTVTPGTPMSASIGNGFMIGTNTGSVFGWWNDIAVLTPSDTWYSAENTMIPWRDGFVAGLDNGAIMYWSPSNNPVSNPVTDPFVPLNGTSMALDYADSTIPTQIAQPPGWSQLQGPIGQAATSMVQMGDGFAVGFTAPDDSSNGAVMMFTGFGPGSATSAFGYLQATNTSGQTTLQALTPSNSWSQIAGASTLPVANGTPGSVQQMLPINQFTKDSAGNWWNTSSLVVGLTDNGIYSWEGSNLTSSDTAWNQQQAPAPLPGQLDATTLQGAWDFATGATAPTGAFGNSKAVGGADDPIFSQVFNQAACGSISNCNSQGDYETFALNYPLGDNGVIYSYGTDLRADLNMTAAGYGYLFVPNGILDKFEPDQYSAGLVLGLLVGPSVTLNIQNGGSVKETLKAHYDYTDMQDTEVGVFGETVGVDASLTGVLSVNPSVPSPLPLAWAYYIPGLQFTWNTNGNPDSMGMSYSAFSDTGYVTADQLEAFFDPTVKATITATVTPYATVSYGLFTTSPIDLSIFKLSLGFQNPITAELTVPLNNLADTALSLSSQGFLTADAAFIPQITSDLTWKGKYQLYSVKDQIS